MSEVDAILSCFNLIGHGISVWTEDEHLLAFNSSYADVFSDDVSNLADGISLTTLLEQLFSSGLLVIQTPQAAWIQEQLEAFRSHRTSNYLFSNGRVCKIERWELPERRTVSLCTDITEESRALKSLKKALDKAEGAGITKSRFLQAANHDLRQPLASLKILIYNCMVAEDEAQRENLLHTMDISVSIMEDLLGALLNIGQLDAGQIQPRIATFQLATLFERLEIEYGHQAREKGLDFRIVPCRLAAESDRALLERIISNFVSNAIRYTDTGGVLVGCRRAGTDLRVEVWDTGRGISEPHQPAIFDEFFQIQERAIGEKRKGLGLGLNIAKRIADILKHKISVRSIPGRGSVFTILFPMGDILHSNMGEIEISERIGGEFKGLSVIVLEDDELFRSALTELLERWGINVTDFNSVENIVSLVQEHCPEPDLIITDFRLRGGEEGTEVVNRIRHSLNINCPAVVVTADTEPKLLQSIRDKGFPILIKPVSPPSLRVMMHSILYEPEQIGIASNRNSPNSS